MVVGDRGAPSMFHLSRLDHAAVNGIAYAKSEMNMTRTRCYNAHRDIIIIIIIITTTMFMVLSS